MLQKKGPASTGSDLHQTHDLMKIIKYFIVFKEIYSIIESKKIKDCEMVERKWSTVHDFQFEREETYQCI